jgi:SWI/SNF-related matrix-associated actin-dependent regulator of chromatin subfamily D
MKQKRKLRIFISNTFYPAKEPAEGEEGSVASWELRVEGRLLEDSKNDPNKVCVIVYLLLYHNALHCCTAQ